MDDTRQEIENIGDGISQIGQVKRQDPKICL
jgi:hypothetical protein